MAKSPARKIREKLEREGKLNPKMKRKTNSDYAEISQHVRLDKDKTKYSRKSKYKQNRSLNHDDSGSVIFLFFFGQTIY